jgi:hypothetical protein
MKRIIAALILTLALPVAARAQAPSKQGGTAQLRADMRKLWEDHVTWTRVYIISVASGTADKDVTAQRLLQNQVDIGNAIKPFYGDEAANKLTVLLKEHILGAAALLDAAKAGDTAKTESAKAAWFRNGDDIAAFLSAANAKYWPLADMKHHMKNHLDLTLQEALDRFAGKFQQDIQDYDRVHEQILQLADALTDGIAGQFPDRFKKA